MGNTLYYRLGLLFMEFKGRPALCAMYPAIKLAGRIAKGALLGVFYGKRGTAALYIRVEWSVAVQLWVAL